MTAAPLGRFETGPMREDWWAVVIGLLLVAIGAFVYHAGYHLASLAVLPHPWTSLAELRLQAAQDFPNYLGLAAIFLALFTTATSALGLPPLRFGIGFLILLLLALLTLATTAWTPANRIGLEPTVVALLLGVLLGNAVALPGWMKDALRAELYIKTGVVLLGATIPLPLLRLAGPVAIFQASLVAVVTFVTIYGVARFLGVDRRLGAMLAAGGSVCGVSAVIAVAGAVRARREDVSIATSMVVAWALGMIVLLPLLAHAWYLPAGPAGAWIGTSQFADAAGFATVRVFCELLHGGALSGTDDQALWAFTLVKVIGRDLWVGFWAVAISVYAALCWEPTEGQPLELAQIWHRFPKFIIGFFLASLLVAWADETTSVADFNATIQPNLIEPLNALRTLMFTLSFLSIGASVRLRSLLPIGANAFIAFATGVLANLTLGFILSSMIFASYWNGLTR